MVFQNLQRLKIGFTKFFQLFVQDPKYLVFFIFGRITVLRRIVHRFFYVKSTIEKYSESNSNSWFEQIDTNYVVKSLQQDGIYLNFNLPTSVHQEILEFANHTQCWGNKDSRYPFHFSHRQTAEKQYQKRFVVGEYPDLDRNCPIIHQLSKDPKILAIAARYFQTTPVFMGSRMWWSFLSETSREDRLRFAQELFHYDMIDYRSIKFIFYLTDVDCYSAAHECVIGSHKQKKLTHQFSLFAGCDRNEIINTYGLFRIKTICGQAGFGFVEDPFCFHRGTVPIHRERLYIQIEYGISQYNFRSWNEYKSILEVV